VEEARLGELAGMLLKAQLRIKNDAYSCCNMSGNNNNYYYYYRQHPYQWYLLSKIAN